MIFTITWIAQTEVTGRIKKKFLNFRLFLMTILIEGNILSKIVFYVQTFTGHCKQNLKYGNKELQPLELKKFYVC